MNPAAKGKGILSISYDEPLLVTRQMMLEQAGFTVTSALGFTDAIEKCNTGDFDLFMIGHSIPLKDKAAIVAAIRQHSRSPILSIRRHGMNPLPEVDLSVDAQDGPQVLLNAVNDALGLSRS
jgi:CheY-like chemotaxis protein